MTEVQLKRHSCLVTVLPVPNLQDSSQYNIVASCSANQEQLHYNKHPDHPPPSHRIIPSPEGFTSGGT